MGTILVRLPPGVSWALRPLRLPWRHHWWDRDRRRFLLPFGTLQEMEPDIPGRQYLFVVCAAGRRLPRLAFSSIADAGTTTLVETLLEDGLLDKPRFAIYYGKELNDTGAGPGEGVITIGASEEDKYVDGELTWIEPLQQFNGQYQLWRGPAWFRCSAMASPNNGSSGATILWRSLGRLRHRRWRLSPFRIPWPSLCTSPLG